MKQTNPPTSAYRRRQLSSLSDAVFCPQARLRRAVPASFRPRKFLSVLRYYPLREPFLTSNREAIRFLRATRVVISYLNLRTENSGIPTHQRLRSATASAKQNLPFPFYSKNWGAKKWKKRKGKFWFCGFALTSLYNNKPKWYIPQSIILC